MLSKSCTWHEKYFGSRGERGGKRGGSERFQKFLSEFFFKGEVSNFGVKNILARGIVRLILPFIFIGSFASRTILMKISGGDGRVFQS